ncbi:MAG: ROK family protein [Chloroflexota bacterium]
MSTSEPIRDRPDETRPYVLVGDVGGTNMRAALVDREGKVLRRSQCPTEPEAGIEDAARRFAEILRDAGSETSEGETGHEVVISSAGPLQPGSGVYNHPPNLTGWDGLSLKPGIERAMGCEVYVGHDATLAALGETRYGEAAGAQNLVYVTVSTGVGGGIIANGRMVTGANGHAGELGHILVMPGGQSCNVGCNGCLEGMTSGTGIARAARARISGGADSALLEMAGGDPEEITSRMVFEAAANGDAAANEVVDTVMEALSLGFATICNALDPEALVVGGGVVHGLQAYWEELGRRAGGYALPHFDGEIPLHISGLGDDVSLIGAAALAFDHADGLW